MTYQLVIFDLAGTTVKDNNDVHRVLQVALLKHGVEISIEDANAVMGIPKPVAIAALLEKRHHGTKEITGSWINDIHRDFVDDMIRFYETDPSVGEKPGVRETFRILKESGVRIAVDTGFDRRVTGPLLDRLGWFRDDLVDCSVTSDEVAKGRPYPDMIFEAMKQTGVTDVEHVVKVGDTISDIRQGRAAGCGLVVAVTSGAFSAEELRQEKPDHLIDQLPDLLPFLTGL
jgi:phosphonatase-like hydrolase